MQQLSESPSRISHDYLYEVVDGQRRDLRPTGTNESILISELCALLGEYIDDYKQGLVVPQMLFQLDEQAQLMRRPDIAFVSYSRWHSMPASNSKSWNVIPDFVIDIIDQYDLSVEIDRKLTDYFDAGVRLVWLILPNVAVAYSYPSPRFGRRLYQIGTLDGGKVLPGFELPLETLFAVTKRPS